jgi:hypothetical protein
VASRRVAGRSSNWSARNPSHPARRSDIDASAAVIRPPKARADGEQCGARAVAGKADEVALGREVVNDGVPFDKILSRRIRSAAKLTSVNAPSPTMNVRVRRQAESPADPHRTAQSDRGWRYARSASAAEAPAAMELPPASSRQRLTNLSTYRRCRLR